MSGDDLAIFLFFLTCAVAFGLEAVKAETAFRRGAFGIIAAGWLLAGLFWGQIQTTWPILSQRISEVATNPVSWFVVLMFMLAVFAFHRPQGRSQDHNKKDQPTHSKQIQLEPRERIYTQATASELHALYQNKTSVQADVLASSHIDKWISLKGTVQEVVRYKDGEVSVALHEQGGPFVAARFVGEQADKAVHLTRESEISIVGRVSNIDTLVIRLSDCELL